MRTRRCVVLTLAAIGALGACQPAPQGISDKDVTDIKASIDRWLNDFLANKRDDLANIITEDMVLLPPNSPPMIGREASMAYMRAYPAITKFTATKDEVAGQGDVAYVRGTYELDATMPDKSAIHDKGTFLEVHRRQKDGTWAYSRLSWHSSEPLPAPAPAPAKKR